MTGTRLLPSLGLMSSSWRSVEGKRHLGLLKASHLISFRSRSVSGASTGLSSSPLSSPRVRPGPRWIKGGKGVKTLWSKAEAAEIIIPMKSWDIASLSLKRQRPKASLVF